MSGRAKTTVKSGERLNQIGILGARLSNAWPVARYRSPRRLAVGFIHHSWLIILYFEGKRTFCTVKTRDWLSVCLATTVEAQQIAQHSLIHPLPLGGQRMLRRQRLARAGVSPHCRPVFGPVALRVRTSVGGRHGAVELFVGEFERSAARCTGL